MLKFSLAFLMSLGVPQVACAFECVFRISDDVIYKVVLDTQTNHMTIQQKYSSWQVQGFAVQSGRHSYTYFLQWAPTEYLSLTRMWEPNKNPTCFKDKCGVCEDQPAPKP